jgi:hypothetical protein
MVAATSLVVSFNPTVDAIVISSLRPLVHGSDLVGPEPGTTNTDTAKQADQTS